MSDASLASAPKGWRTDRLGNFSTLQRGFDITVAEQRPGSIPVVSSSGISSVHDTARCSGPGVVIGRKGKLGNVYFISGSYWPHDTSLWVKEFHGNDPQFVALVLRSLRLDRFDAATSVPTLNRNFVHPLPVSIPPLPEQRKIASILTTVDSLIEQTEALIEKYRRVKQGMMADLLSRGVDSDGKLRPTQQQAPELYKQSELGWIPREWDELRVSDVLIGRPKNGHSPIESNVNTGAYLLGLSCLTRDGFAPIQLKNAPVSDPKLRGAELRTGDLLISRSNTVELVGLVGRYRDIGVPCFYPDLMMRLTPNERSHPEFLELLLRFDSVRRQLTNASCGTSGSMKKINGAMVLNTVLPVPCPDEQQAILDCLAPVSQLVRNEEWNLAKIMNAKTGLMQDLLTGKVRVNVDQDEEVTADV